MPKQPKTRGESKVKLLIELSNEELSLLRLEMQISAFEYYVVARWACQQRLFDIVGALLHHAFERLLKAALVEHVPLEELTSSKHFGHDLPKLWEKFRNVYGIQDLSMDALAARLHEFEDHRYPENRLNNSDQVSIGGMGYWGVGFKLRDEPGKNFTLDVQHYEPWWKMIRQASSLEFDENSFSIGQEAIATYRWKPNEGK